MQTIYLIEHGFEGCAITSHAQVEAQNDEGAPIGTLSSVVG